MAERKKAVVIGAGLGGLSAAVNLSSDFEVHVFEKNSSAGGKAGEINLNGFRFDTGPSLLTMPSILKNIFYDQGEKPEDYLDMQPLDNLCRYFYPDGTIMNGYSLIEKFAEEIESKTADNQEAVKKYFDYSKKIYDVTADIFLYKSLNEIDTYSNLKTVKSFLEIFKIDSFRSVHEANSKFFRGPKVIQLFDRYATYSGSNPYKAPATLNIIPYVEFVLGGFVVKGGIYSIVKALQKLAVKKNVKFHFNSDVTKILQDGKRTVGIEYDNRKSQNNTFYSEILIVNSDAQFTKEKLLRETPKEKPPEVSSSAIVFYWGIEGNYAGLEIHNILFSENYKKEFDEIFDERKIPSDPTVYIYISCKFNKDDAPDGHENWFVMINTPYNEGENWTEKIPEVRKSVIQKIKDFLKIDLSGKIIEEEILTPEILEDKTNSYKGSIYGISSNSRKAAFLRQRNKSSKTKGLYFCGGSAHPGGGIPLVLQSGKITADLVRKYEL